MRYTQDISLGDAVSYYKAAAPRHRDRRYSKQVIFDMYWQALICVMILKALSLTFQCELFTLQCMLFLQATSIAYRLLLLAGWSKSCLRENPQHE
jgi:hypothetical protein